MNVRIGNDIKVNVVLPDYIDPQMILRMTATLHKVNNIHHNNCCTNYYIPTEYTMHRHSCYSYNVIPHNMVCCHLHECFDHCCHRHRKETVAIKPTGLNHFEIFYKGRNQEPGLYRLTVNIQVQEDGWGANDIHEYTIDYGPVFSISNRYNS